MLYSLLILNAFESLSLMILKKTNNETGTHIFNSDKYDGM
jgi:hypothetical protein